MTRPVTFSIITICYNSATTIERTIESVARGRGDDTEYIVIDGGSTDGTLALIDKYAESIDVLVSEPDRGIGDAWNKGLRRARGTYIILLNADDELEPRALQTFLETPDLDEGAVFYGSTDFIDSTGRVVGVSSARFDPTRLLSGFGFMHTSCIVPKRVYDLVGPFDPSVKIAVDTEWLLRAFRKGIPFRKSAHKVRMRTGGVSDINKRRAFGEYIELLRKTGRYGRYALLTARARHEAALAVMELRKKAPSAATQALFFYVRAANTILNLAPTHGMRRRLAGLLRVTMAQGATIHGKIRFFGLARVAVGRDSVVNRGCYLDNRDEIRIGQNVSIAHDVKIYTGGHDVTSPTFAFRKAPVSIEDFAVLFSSCLIQPGVTIGRGAVILPGSVVTRDVEPMTIVGGSPAVVKGHRDCDLEYNCRYGFWCTP